MRCRECSAVLPESSECEGLACPSASSYRRGLLVYFRLQLVADLAVAAWLPIPLAGLWISTGRPPLLGGAAAVAGLAAVAAVLRLAWFSRPAVPVADVLSVARLRLARQATALHRHRRGIERLEVLVINPLLFSLLTVAAVRAATSGDRGGLALVLALLAGSWVLYLGPSRRLRPNPAGDLAAWLAAADTLLSSGRLSPGCWIRSDGGLDHAGERGGGS